MNYLFLIKEDYVRDTQLSSIGYDVKDLYADELIVEDNDKSIYVEPFMDDIDYKDEDIRDFFGPVVLGIWQPAGLESKEDLLKRIAKEYFIPLKYLIAVPIDSSFTGIESIFN